MLYFLRVEEMDSMLISVFINNFTFMYLYLSASSMSIIVILALLMRTSRVA